MVAGLCSRWHCASWFGCSQLQYTRRRHGAYPTWWRSSRRGSVPPLRCGKSFPPPCYHSSCPCRSCCKPGHAWSAGPDTGVSNAGYHDQSGRSRPLAGAVAKAPFAKHHKPTLAFACFLPRSSGCTYGPVRQCPSSAPRLHYGPCGWQRHPLPGDRAALAIFATIGLFQPTTSAIVPAT